ncbi:hypothetical protein V6N12_044503 [Hibiscus sabdariffa]|uniref:Uncharacterized protein n=1 Tax=Hibiscus sabdariffa TaxID=183260 RepID=A0ABR2BNR2_9ROSI
MDGSSVINLQDSDHVLVMEHFSDDEDHSFDSNLENMYDVTAQGVLLRRQSDFGDLLSLGLVETYTKDLTVSC